VVEQTSVGANGAVWRPWHATQPFATGCAVVAVLWMIATFMLWHGPPGPAQLLVSSVCDASTFACIVFMVAVFTVWQPPWVQLPFQLLWPMEFAGSGWHCVQPVGPPWMFCRFRVVWHVEQV
jgi:hypothetical protein